METLKKVCILTGASGTLGQAFIEKYKSKYTIIGTYNNRRIQGSLPLEEYNPAGSDAVVYSASVDLTQLQEVRKFCEMVHVRVGDIDLLINNAAVIYFTNILTRDALTATRHTMQVNFLAPYQMIVFFAQLGWKDSDVNTERNRNIINISSVSGSVAVDDGRYGGYAASKAALDHLTRHLYTDLLKRGIRINVVAPDTIGTRVSMDRVLETVVSMDEGDITGQVVTVSDV